jgi:hypothetical protein
LQRVYGLYARSRALNIKYVHTPLGRVDYQGLMPLLAGHAEPDFCRPPGRPVRSRKRGAACEDGLAGAGKRRRCIFAGQG